MAKKKIEPKLNKMTLAKISNPAFTKSMENFIQTKVPVRAAFKLKTLTNKFNEELKKFQELRIQILERHCDRDDEAKPAIDENGNYKFSNAIQVQLVTKEINDLLSIEIEFTPILIADLGDMSLSGDELLSLGEVISDV